jgi:hypothetical protein
VPRHRVSLVVFGVSSPPWSETSRAGSPGHSEKAGSVSGADADDDLNDFYHGGAKIVEPHGGRRVRVVRNVVVVRRPGHRDVSHVEAHRVPVVGHDPRVASHHQALTIAPPVSAVLLVLSTVVE